MPSGTEDALSVLHSAANKASISQQNQLKAVCSCNWNKGTLQYKVKFPTGKINKGKKGETLTGLNLIKPCLTDTFPTICRNRFPWKSLVRHKYSLLHRINSRQYIQPPGGRTPWSDRSQQPIGKLWVTAKDHMGRGKRTTNKTQTALIHCTSSALPTTATTHVPTELVLQLKLTYSAYSPPAVIPVFFTYWEENCMKKHNGEDSKVHHHCTINYNTEDV